MSVSEYIPSSSQGAKPRDAAANDHRATRNRRILIGLGILVLIGLGWWGYHALFPAHKHVAPPAQVRVAQAQKQDVSVMLNTIATVVSPATVQVTAQIQGKLLKAFFQEGQMVHKGDPLFLIDPVPFQNALAQAQAQFAKDLATAQAAANDQRRYTALYAQNAISQQQRDQAVATAKADAAVVLADQAAINIAQENLGYARIVSPIDGKTGPIQIQPGNLITVAGATPLVTIAQVQPIKLSISVPQNQLTQVQNQMTAGKLQAIVPMPGAENGHEIAPVDFISNTVSANTGTIEVRATFPNTDMRLVPGQSVNVGITLNQVQGATVVPRDAVNVGPDASYVYVVGPDNVVSSKPVKVLNDDGTLDAIQGDVKPGDRVVVEGQLRVVPGAKVTIRKGGGAVAAPASDMPS
ncbi:MAG TPA: efflux RND transporter periplasmic adaptor subunit [Rhizomicrobium sp.]